MPETQAGSRLPEDELRESEERYRRIVEGVKDHAIFVTDAQGIVVDWTPGAQAIFGWTAAEIEGQSTALLFTPEDRAAGVPERELAAARAEGCAADERWHLRRDGSRFFANGSTRPLHGANGAVTGFIKIARDETERRAVEARLSASEEFNRRILASSADCIKVLDLDGRLEFMSEGAMCVMEVDDFGTVEGRCWPDFWQGEEHALALGAVEAAKRGEVGRFQGFATTMKGSPRWWDVIVTAVAGADGAPEKLLSISRDVTATKLAEDAVRELNTSLEERVAVRTRERDMLARIVENTDVMVMAADLDYNILAINKANADEFERLYGVRPGPGDNMLQLLEGQPEHQAQVRAGWAKGLSGEEVTFVEDFGDAARDRPYYEIKFSPLFNAEGDRIGAYQFVTDVSERLRRERQLSDTQEALRQSQKVEALGQLTGGIAHDFNNLLTVIRGSADLLRRRELTEDKRRRYIEAISDTADRAAKLTGQLLAFARRQSLRPEVFDTAERLGGITEMLRTLLGSRIALSLDVHAAEACFVEADAGQFETALVNMAVNARDAMEGEGALTVAIRVVPEIPRIRGHQGASGEFVAISVSDTGSGIAKEHLDRIFEPFFTTKEVGKGTGLGLSQLFGFAKQSGGEVDVESTAGEGTTFTLYLPRADAGRAIPAGPPEIKPMPPRGRILVVEDNDEVGEFATELIADLGYQTTLARNAGQALDCLERESESFTLVFSDVVMPGMGGVELGKRIRERWPALPVVLTSGYSHVLVEDTQHGFPLLKKPYSVEELSRTLREAATQAA
jgi:PAS domain S-box-containing protein